MLITMPYYAAVHRTSILLLAISCAGYQRGGLIFVGLSGIENFANLEALDTGYSASRNQNRSTPVLGSSWSLKLDHTPTSSS